ncbi:uncharacterized protein LOC134224640 [Armigeres subalbatus]|uniref:uncharacterized protein LOC134224640 n=1 Tax=Armigeres subalbatus TaxID=124917 RepID=UPI002ED40C0D
MVHVGCVFDKCGNIRKKNGKVSFFSFPKEPELLQKWINFVNQHNRTPLIAGKLDRDKMKICHMHFEKNQVQTKVNSDRVLLRNSVPRCPPGIIDKAHALNKNKTRKCKYNQANTTSSHNGTADKTKSKDKSTVEGLPLYHTINGYVVDLRIAALQETFRLPNGKLIQVRRQPKKGSDAELPTVPLQLNKKPVDSAPDLPSSSAAKSPPANTSSTSPKHVPEERILNEPVVSGETETTSIDLPTAPVNSHNSKPSKTYTNRRSFPPRTAATAAGSLLALANDKLTVRKPVYQPPLSALQSLLYKQHPDTPFGNHMKEFEGQLLNVAEYSLHVISKINTLLHSNSYKAATESRDVKYLYHSVGYILEYAMARFNGVEESCVHEIQNMGFTKHCDLGPFVSKQTKAPSTASVTKPSEEKPTEPQSEPSEVEPDRNEAENDDADDDADDDDDDDCAIIEQRTDIIEVDSDDESDENEDDDSEDQKTEPAEITLKPNQLRICSDTESIEPDDTSNDSKQSAKTTPEDKSVDSDKKSQINDQESRSEAILPSNETTEIQVVMSEVKETTIVHDYYYQAYSDDDDDDDDGEGVVQSNQDDMEIMEVDDDDTSSSGEQQEETEELIEIIEGDIDLELEDGQEYKVIEVIDGDIDNW